VPTHIATDQGLLSRIRAAASRPITREQMYRQRVSFIVGGLSKDSTVTRSQIEAVLDEGHPA